MINYDHAAKALTYLVDTDEECGRNSSPANDWIWFHTGQNVHEDKSVARLLNDSFLIEEDPTGGVFGYLSHINAS